MTSISFPPTISIETSGDENGEKYDYCYTACPYKGISLINLDFYIKVDVVGVILHR